MRFLVVFLISSTLYAACTGSGLTWSCAAGSTSANVASVISSATDGATVTFAAGSYSWGTFNSFSNTKGITMICASVGACNVTASGTVLGMNGNLSGTNTKLYRISGFTFVNAPSFTIWFYGAGTMTQIRIDHNAFTNCEDQGTIMFFGENSTVANFYGVVDHNTFAGSGSLAAFQMIGAPNSSPPTSQFGTTNNLFFEDNTITVTTMDNAGLGCVDGWGGDAIVWRHNISTNCLTTQHGVTHAGGPSNWEVYENDFRVNSGASAQGVSDGYRLLHHQGSGEFIAFNNKFTASTTPHNDEAISLLHYRDYLNAIDSQDVQCDGLQSKDGNRSTTAVNRGYPCWRQPGRDFAGNLKPVYAWNNYWTNDNSKVVLQVPDNGGSPDYYAQHMVADREYFDSVSASAQSSATSPFNGTTGMGFGTLARRPATCSVGARQAADAGAGGVGYFATDDGTQGTLYKCSTANTWTVAYTPYTYPHPLTASGGQSVPPSVSLSGARTSGVR